MMEGSKMSKAEQCYKKRKLSQKFSFDYHITKMKTIPEYISMKIVPENVVAEIQHAFGAAKFRRSLPIFKQSKERIARRKRVYSFRTGKFRLVK